VSPDFWNMGGYALYVWGSFGVAAAIYLWNVIAPQLRRRAILEALGDDE
jgi:heme exporter protein CcmD